MKLGKWIRLHGLSESEVARRLKVSQATINRIVAAEQPPTLRNAARIVHGTNAEVSYDDLLGPEVQRAIWRYNGRLHESGSDVFAA